MNLRVTVVEDNVAFRKTLETVLSVSPGYALAGSYGSVESALAGGRQVGVGKGVGSWDLMVMDIDLPGASGIQGVTLFKEMRPQVKIVMMTVFEEPSTILEAICAGADGYLLKRTPLPEFLAQIRNVADGGGTLSAGVARRVMELVRANPPLPVSSSVAPSRLDLTDRQLDVLRCLVDGMSYKQAADALGISLDTVRTHVRALYKKLQVNSVGEAVSRAIRDRLV